MARELVTITGLEELEAALKARAAELVTVKVALVAEEAELIAADARQEAPYLEGTDPEGHIRDDITVELEGTHATVKVENRHAAFEEFGTVKNPARPFMHTAAERSRKRFPIEAAARIRKAVE